MNKLGIVSLVCFLTIFLAGSVFAANAFNGRAPAQFREGVNVQHLINKFKLKVFYDFDRNIYRVNADPFAGGLDVTVGADTLNSIYVTHGWGRPETGSFVELTLLPGQYLISASMRAIEISTGRSLFLRSRNPGQGERVDVSGRGTGNIKLWLEDRGW